MFVNRIGRIGRRSAFVALSFSLVAAGALLHAACERVTNTSQAAPSQKTAGSTEVLAKIDDVVITVGDFQNRINQQSPYVRARYTSLERKKEFLDNLVRFEVLAKEAQARGLQNDDEVVRTMKQVMIQKLMKDQFDTAVRLEDITDAEIKSYFDAHPEEFNKPEEVRVADILVKDDRTAKKVLADARIKGVDNAGFRTLVAEYSQDPLTKDRGGDLRYFDSSTKELPPEIVKAAFALVNLGDVSQPVRSGAGFHLLKLTGRKKELFKTGKGKYIAPAPIENRINTHPMIELSMVSGVGQQAAYAVVVLAEDLRPKVTDPNVREEVNSNLGALLAEVNNALADYEQLRMFVVAPEPWTIDNGCLTPTMKIKRARIEAAVAPGVDAWYSKKGPVIWA